MNLKIAAGFWMLTSMTAAAAPSGMLRFLDEVDAIKTQTEAVIAEKNNETLLNEAAFSKLMHWTPEVSLSTARAEKLDDAHKNTDSLSVRASMNLFHGGKEHYDYKTADSQYEAQLQKTKEAARIAERAAAQLLFKHIALLEQQKIRAGLVQIKKESLKVIDRMFRVGRLPRQEITKSEIDLSQAESALRSSRIESIDNDLEIKSLIGATVTTDVWPFSVGQGFKPPLSPNLDSRLQMLTFDHLAKEYAYRAAKSAFSPQLDLAVVYSKPFGNTVLDTSGTYGYLTLTMPLWSRWETRAGLAAAHAALLTSDFALVQEKQRFFNEREAAREKLELVRENLKEAQLNLERSKGLFSAVEKNFRIGRISVNDMLLEQARLNDVEFNYVSQLHAFHSSLVENCLLFNETLRQCFE